MKNETKGIIHFAIKDLLKAKKSYPSLYNDDKIMLMAIGAAAMEDPDAPVSEVYQEVRTELLRCSSEDVDGKE